MNAHSAIVLENEFLVPKNPYLVKGNIPMKLARMAILILIFLTAVMTSTAGTDIDLPVRLNRLNNRVVAAWIGDFAQGNQTIAVASKKGIVVIDTYANRIQQQLIRKA